MKLRQEGDFTPPMHAVTTMMLLPVLTSIRQLLGSLLS